MKTVAILEGWAGGPKLTAHVRQSLRAAGFDLTKDIAAAAFIIAHSTGCYMLPATLRAERLIMIDPPFWPGRSIVGRWLDLLKSDRSLLLDKKGYSNLLIKKFWQIYYIVAKPGFTWSIFKNQSNLDFLEKHKKTRLLLIRNIDDQFCSPGIKSELKKFSNVHYIELPGNHEDYYINPEPYIDLLLKEI